MKITIAIPPVIDFYFTPHRFTAQGALIVQKLLQENGHLVNFLNFPGLNKKARPAELPLKLNYLEDYIFKNENSRLSFFTNYKQWGKPFTECAKDIINTKPDLIIISCFAYAYADESIKLAKEIKIIAPKIPITIGGAGASSYPEYFLKNPEIDFILKGEAEVSIKNFISEFTRNNSNYKTVPNLLYKENKIFKYSTIEKYTESKDLDFSYAISHENKKKITISLSLSRGCLKSCSFCSNFICHGKKFRTVPIEKIKHGIKTLNIEKKIHINFEDDNLLYKKDYFFECIKTIRNKYPDCTFSAENGLDYMLLNNEDLKYLIKNNFKQFNFSLASINQILLKNENREINIKKLSEHVNYISKQKIFSIVYFICGLKNDTVKSVLETLIFLHKLPSISGISLFYPVPGLSGYTDYTLFKDDQAYLCKGSSAYPWNKSLSTKEMITAFRLSRLSNLMKEKNKKAIEIELINIILKTRSLHTLIKTQKSDKIVKIKNMDESMVKYFLTRI